MKKLVKFLAKSFKVSKSDIIFKTGQNSKLKILEFSLTDRFEIKVIVGSVYRPSLGNKGK